MHPIERLRHVARIGPERPDLIAREAAHALAVCSDHAELVVSCRRLLDRQPAAGPLWWMAGRALTAADLRAELVAVVAELDADPTIDLLEAALGARPSDTTREFVDAWAMGEEGVLADPRAVRRALASYEPVWVIAGVGRILPSAVWSTARRRAEEGPRPVAALLPRDRVALVAGPDGLEEFGQALLRAGGPVAPEILDPPPRVQP